MPPDTNIPTPRTDAFDQENANMLTLALDISNLSKAIPLAYSRLLDFARTLERENIQLREEFDNFKKKITLQRMFAICEKDGHTTTEDGCAFCLKQELEQFRNTVDAHDYDKVNQQLSAFKQCCEELVNTIHGIHVFGIPDSQCIVCQNTTRAEQLLKGEE